jgi:inosose dehydratase
MSEIRVANAPCSWGVLEFDKEKQAGFAQVLDEMAAAGYVGTELGDWGFLPTEPAAQKQELARRRLEMVGGFVPVALADESRHAEGVERAVRTARLLAAVSPKAFLVLADDNGTVPERTKNAGRITRAHRLSTQQWKTFSRGAEQVARAVQEATRLRTVFHHHCAGYVETPQEIDTLLKGTSKDLVGLCLDTGHYAFGGGDPLAALSQYRDRIWHVHFKDCEPQVASRSRREDWDYFQSVRQGVFCELGKGAVPFRRLVADLKEHAYDGWVVVEQDVLAGMGTPKESAQRNRAFLRQLGL